MSSSNYLISHPDTRRRVRLYCFPYAGGNGTIFLPWQRDLLPQFELCGIQMPGRGPRFSEVPFGSMETLVETLARAVAADNNGLPFAFFGHSLGALVAFEVTRHSRAHRMPMPAALIVSGCDAPQHRSPDKKLHELNDQALIESLTDYDGTPQEVLDHPELMTLALPSLRADFRLAASYVYQPDERLDLPITVLSGKEDPHVLLNDVVHWQKETHLDITMHWFEGGHFFINAERDAVLACVNMTIARVLSQHRPVEGVAYTQAPDSGTRIVSL